MSATLRRSRHASTVYFLGAGASKEFGYPLTDELLPCIQAGVKERGFFEEDGKRKVRELSRCLRALVPGFRVSRSMPSIVEVLSLLDHATTQGHAFAHDGRHANLVTWRRILEEALLTVISEVDNTPDPNLDPLLETFSRWLGSRCREQPGALAIISTNYDIALEYELYRDQAPARVAREWDLGMTWRNPQNGRVLPRPEAPIYRLYKLHGSTNWLRCPRCEHVYVQPAGTIAHQPFRKVLSDNNRCHCGHGPLRPVIVAPSMVRDLRDPMLLQIWTSAYECLRRATKLVFIGYSLPYEDIAIRSLLLRALHGRDEGAPKLRVEVVQRPLSDDPARRARQQESRDRYVALFPDCKLNSCGAKGYIEAIAVGATRRRRHPRSSTSSLRPLGA